MQMKHSASQKRSINSLLLKKTQQSNDILSDILVQILLGNKHEYQTLNNFHTLETTYCPPGDAEKEMRPSSLAGYQLTGQQPHLPF